MKKLLLTIFASTVLFVAPSSSYGDAPFHTYGTKVGDWWVDEYKLGSDHYCRLTHESWFRLKIIDINGDKRGVEVRIYKIPHYKPIENRNGHLAKHYTEKSVVEFFRYMACGVRGKR